MFWEKGTDERKERIEQSLDRLIYNWKGHDREATDKFIKENYADLLKEGKHEEVWQMAVHEVRKAAGYV